MGSVSREDFFSRKFVDPDSHVIDLTASDNKGTNGPVPTRPTKRSPSNREGYYDSWFCTQFVNGTTSTGDVLPNDDQFATIIDRLTQFTTYIGAVKELAPSTGKEHYHFYVKTKEKMTKARMIALTSSTCDVEVTKGNFEQSLVYFEKTGMPILEIGDRPEITKDGPYRKHLHSVMLEKFTQNNYQLERMTDLEIFRFGSGLNMVREVRMGTAELKKLEGNLKNHHTWLIGPPGCGKTTYAIHTLTRAGGKYYDHLPNKWFDGNTDPTLPWLFDDLGPDNRHLAQLLKRAADRQPFSTEYKGGTLMVRPEKVIVTSNYSLEEFCGEDKDLYNALERRFNVLVFSRERSRSWLAELNPDLPPLSDQVYDDFENRYFARTVAYHQPGNSGTFVPPTPDETPSQSTITTLPVSVGATLPTVLVDDPPKLTRCETFVMDRRPACRTPYPTKKNRVDIKGEESDDEA